MSGTTLDATDLMLLQFPEMWDSPSAYHDITTYGAEIPGLKSVCEYSLETKMSGTWIPGCEKCGSEEHNGLQQICDNNEDQDVLNVCDKCYKKTCCDRCEQSTIVRKYRLTFADKTTTFTLCYDCHDNYKHADEDEEE